MQSRPLPSRPLLSVIVPVFNEKSTVPIVLKQLLDLRLTEMDLEIIVVESNSNDGSREAILQFRSHAAVRIILENAPGGKGRAVRKGLQAARGDIILIQDADLEYDMGDYPALLQPILSAQTSFVLGTRHAGGLHIRDFRGAKLLSLFYNAGHWLLTGLINVLYREHLTDPFTMYKVFRRECIDAMVFKCDRFDFDCELVCNLLRDGHSPLEVPIRYTSRSFADGKKVRTFRDPPTWIRAIIRCRFARVLRVASAPVVVLVEGELEKCNAANAD